MGAAVVVAGAAVVGAAAVDGGVVVLGVADVVGADVGITVDDDDKVVDGPVPDVSRGSSAGASAEGALAIASVVAVDSPHAPTSTSGNTTTATRCKDNTSST